MARGEKKITDQEISAAKKALQSLEPKVVGKSRDEAFLVLEKELKEALKKGYSIKEISDVLKNTGVVMPVSYLKKLTESGGRKRAGRKSKANNEVSPVSMKNDEINQENNSRDSGTDDVTNFVKPDLPDEEL